ncbi:Leucine-rich repeat-containing protein 24 [Paragonimus heterotremus]|uniref:Leucine-rich repeat-containing protein 24 n=1 Tax=Paragonimus heterotremus TaxID=100268 RepID=A0A8J4WK63_9TREM|nr:Leucine-rich repeat-containing protein 24 [Paragonimus heterotremus]
MANSLRNPSQPIRLPLPPLISYTLLIAIILPANTISPECPSECQCVSNRMNCEQPGLKRLPAPYMPTLEYLLVENQTFESTHLGPSELIMYRTPDYGGQVRLRSLHIRHCNIRTIGRTAFETLGSRLEMLDLSGNPLKHIGDYAFSGLGQLTLILDKISQPIFDDHTFSGVSKVKSLIMRHSKLTTLPYIPLLQLATDGKLDRLLLKGNEFRSIDSKYERIFESLQDFEINENPWHCDCQLTWLIRRYQSMMKNRVQRSRRSSTDRTHVSNWDQEENQPKCASPPSLFGRNFSDLITDIEDVYSRTVKQPSLYSSPTIIHCPPPQFERLDVDLRQYMSGTEFGSVQLTSDPVKPSMYLKCVMKGSNQLAVKWRYHDPSLGVTSILDSNTTQLRRNLPTKEQNSWLFRLDDIIQTESSMRIEKQQTSDTYSCLGEDVIGNVSAVIRIQWPSTPSAPNTPPKLDALQATLNRSQATVNPDWSPEVFLSSQSVLHAPQFSLSQLLGAIAGTFLATLLLFFLIHRTLHCKLSPCHSRKPFSDQSKADTGCSAPTGVSPAGTSSSNTSSNAKLVSPQKVNEFYPTSLSIHHIHPEALSLTANLMNAHAYHQFMNGNVQMGPHALPVGIPNPLLCQQPTSLSHHMHLVPVPSTNSASTAAAYEPVAYSDANNVIYDVPWLIKHVNGLAHMGTHSAEQHVPLLFSASQSTEENVSAVSSAAAVQPALSIPPPPSIPQPSLPTTPTSLTLNSTLSRTPSTATNLLALQSNYPLAQPNCVGAGGLNAPTGFQNHPFHN